MTREEAIKILDVERMSLKRLTIDSNIIQLKPKYEAIIMAIEALKVQESYDLKNGLSNHFSNACDLCVQKNIMCNICMTADKWEPKESK